MSQTGSPEYHVRTHPSAVEHWRHVIEIVAFIVAAAWGFYVFVYQERIKPASESPNLDFNVTVRHQDLIHNKELVSMALSWHNKGAADAQVDGFIYNVYGLRYGARPNRLIDMPPETGDRAPGILITRALQPALELIQARYFAWKPLGGTYGSDVGPQDTLTIQDDFVLARGNYEAIFVRYSYCFRRSDDTRSVRFQGRRDADGSINNRSIGRAEVAGSIETNCHINRGVFAL